MCPQEKSRRREINELAALMRQVMWPKTTIYLSCDTNLDIKQKFTYDAYRRFDADSEEKLKSPVADK